VIGRIEPLHDRKNGELRVLGVWWEDGVRPVSLQAPLRNLARFLGARLTVPGTVKSASQLGRVSGGHGPDG